MNMITGIKFIRIIKKYGKYIYIFIENNIKYLYINIIPRIIYEVKIAFTDRLILIVWFQTEILYSSSFFSKGKVSIT